MAKLKQKLHENLGFKNLSRENHNMWHPANILSKQIIPLLLFQLSPICKKLTAHRTKLSIFYLVGEKGN
ncbi:MAG: hypothetical protein AMJ73_04810 [candidate division Zixibacteria bacterium SM1_73]|nr:MAG: hypothetical protein AMJ73_04810 [candidate division Zixibacteria bacterium SM1_73]